MKQITCEMCGGTDLVKQEGVFTCQSCGLKYSHEEVKKMMIEGTVEITGTVTIDKSGEIETLHKRMTQFLEDAGRARANSAVITLSALGKLIDVNTYANRILDIDPENSPAYMGKFFQNMSLISEEEIVDCDETDLLSNEYLQKALRFANPSYRERLEGFISEAQSKYQETVTRLTPIRNALPTGRIAASLTSAVGVRTDGTVVSFGVKYSDILNDWHGIVAVAEGTDHTVGLKADGTVVVACDSMYAGEGICNVSDWRNIVAIAAGDYITLGLKADGTVVMPGLHDGLQGDWQNIVAIAASENHIVGLKSDGTVISPGKFTSYELSSMAKYQDIVAVAVADENIILRANGRVVTGYGVEYNWRDIVAVAATDMLTVGLKADGTVVAYFDSSFAEESAKPISCEIDSWRGIVAISLSGNNIIGLRRDGIVVVAGGGNAALQSDVSSWRDMAVCSDVELRENILKSAEARKHQSNQWAAQGLCTHCGGKFGLFGKCKKCRSVK